jgi:hypothetical protein
VYKRQTPERKNSDRPNISGAIFVDGSLSMAGYINSSGSVYASTISTLDSIFDPQKTKYFSFDSTAKPIDRDKFFDSARQAGFYQGKDSKIDVALDSKTGTSSSLVVVITDLEQDRADVNRIAQKLVPYLQQPNSAVGLIGIKSNFNGNVYNVDNSKFTYNKERPFYLLAIGDESAVISLTSKLKTKIGGSVQSLIFRQHLAGDELAYLEPGERPESLRGKVSTPQSLQQDMLIQRGEQPMVLLEIDKRAQEPLSGLTYTFKFPGGDDTLTPTIATDRVQITKVLAYNPTNKKMDDNTTVSKALQFKVSQTGKTGKVDLTINAQTQNLPVGMYYLTADLPIAGLTAPSTWQSWHQDINKPRNNDGSKTQGLLDFIDALGIKVSEQQKIAGRFCFAIQRN